MDITIIEKYVGKIIDNIANETKTKDKKLIAAIINKWEKYKEKFFGQNSQK